MGQMNCARGCGLVFSLSMGGVETLFYQFTGDVSEGGALSPILIVGTDGNIYGVTAAGGDYQHTTGNGVFGDGTFFRLTPDGVETTLHSFGGTVN